jgi:hypothetical protein
VIAVIDATDLRLRGGDPACRSPIVALAVAIRCGYCWLLLSLFRPGGGVAFGPVVLRILIAVHS